MAEDIKSPQFPESIFEGTLSTWLKKEGDTFEQDDVLAEIETDKVVIEVTAQSDGQLEKIIIPEGSVIKSQETIGNYSKKITKKDRELDLKTFEIPYEERDHALYVAYGPYKNPHYAVSVVVEHGGNGSTTAAPMAKELFKLTIDRHLLRQSINDKKYLDI